MGHLEQVDARNPGLEQTRVDVFLDVACQQEATAADRPEQHDRHVVDPGPAVGRFDGHACRGSGHRTVIEISSTVRRSPAARPERSGAPGATQSSSHAA